ncbi:hypothetical protein AVEN_33720-1 [Araneus ventricosus]|uniref:Uncharacterized protein n=1 Tax=Araneus ventricosus TaxID=182803 RepID=A0A4Y2E1C0_ARAVE|nr:hypothetical protein AVEN_33720-1 [Araneus ventricosus]
MTHCLTPLSGVKSSEVGSLGIRCRTILASGPAGPMFETRFHQRFYVYVGLWHAKSDAMCQTLSRWCGAEVWKGVLAQVSSSSSDRGSK